MKLSFNKIGHFINKQLTLRNLLIANVVVLVAKICCTVFLGLRGNAFEDWRIARNIVEYGVYAEYINVGPTAYKLPIYPFFLSFFMKLFPGYEKEAIAIAQHLIYFLIPFLFIAITKLFNREKIGIITSFIFLFSPAYLYYSFVYEVTNVFIPLFLVWLFLYFRVYQAKMNKGKDLLILGIWTALLSLTQVVVVPFVAILLFALLLKKKVNFMQFVTIGLVAAVCYSPWIIRNYTVFDRFVPTKTPFWQNIYFSFMENDVNILDQLKLFSENETEKTMIKRLELDEFTMEQIYKEEVVKKLDHRKQLYVIKAAQNAFLTWYVPVRYINDKSFSVLLGRKCFILVIHFFTLLSLIFFYKKNRDLFYLSILLFVCFTIPYMIGHVANTRFKLDFEWYQYLLIAAYLVQRTENKKSTNKIKVD